MSSIGCPKCGESWIDHDQEAGVAVCSVWSPRHPSSQRFHDVLDGWKAMHDRKQLDYGNDSDPFYNVRASEAFGIPAWVGAVLRASDKMRRLERAARQVLAGETVNMANESLIDSFDDLGVYSGIARVLFEEEQK